MAVLPGFNTTLVCFNLAPSSLSLLPFVSFEILLAICLDQGCPTRGPLEGFVRPFIVSSSFTTGIILVYFII